MDIKEKIKNSIDEALKNLKIDEVNFVVEHPEDFKNGDYSTNVGMVLAKNLKTPARNATHSVAGGNPKDLAEKIKNEIKNNLPEEIEKVEVAGAGFINFYLSRNFFINTTKEILKQKEDWGRNKILRGKKIMVEYTDPNPFKPFHIGHLMSNAIGESISRLVEFSGAKVVRANYQGDIGLHVAKTIYILLKNPKYAEKRDSVAEEAFMIGEAYTEGAGVYEEDEEAKKEINKINKKLYDKSDSKINELYEWGRDVTLKAFDEIYDILGTKFEYYFFESEMAPIGIKIVKDHIGSVFEESDGAVVFKGEKYDPRLHTRVFINSHGLPTYEGKEVGLTFTKFKKENPDLSIVVTANEQGEYMKVVQKALSVINKDYESRMKHIVHGMMRFASGKMSSRRGNVITGESLLRDANVMVKEKMKDRDFNEEEKDEVAEVVAVSALKYSILKQAIGADIVYDFDKSISFEGDSGPYLQYTGVRANSVLKKAKSEEIHIGYLDTPLEVTTLEHLLFRFPEVVVRAYESLEPHHIATYLTDLASAFNGFYGTVQIVNKNDPYAPYRVALVEAFLETMKNGLYLLGIKVPKMM